MRSTIVQRHGRETPNVRTTTLQRGLRIFVHLLFDWIGRQHERSLSRRKLMAMNDEQLKDIGLSRSTAFMEGQRHFWE